MCRWTSAWRCKAGSRPKCSALAHSHHSAVRTDSCMTGPCLPVRVSVAVPGAWPTSTKITSPPPTAVRHRPMALPGLPMRPALSTSGSAGAPSISATLCGDLDRGLGALGAAAHHHGAHGADGGGQALDPRLARVAARPLRTPCRRSRPPGAPGLPFGSAPTVGIAPPSSHTQPPCSSSWGVVRAGTRTPPPGSHGPLRRGNPRRSACQVPVQREGTAGV